MPIIPELTGSQGDWSPAAPSTQAAAAPGLALATSGRALLDVGNQLGELGLKLKAVRDNDGLNKARLAFAQAKARHSEFRMRTPDQTKWAGNLTAEISAARQAMGELSVSPSAKAAIDQEWQAWEADTVSETNLAAVQYEITRARQNETNLVEGYLANNDFESARRVKRESQINTPEEAQADILAIDKVEKSWQARAAEQAELDAIAADPLAAQNDLLANPPPADADDATKAKHARKLHTARQAVGLVNQEFAQSIRDGMVAEAGKTPAITTAEQIDQLGAHVSPTVREILKGELADRYDKARKALQRTPKYQHQLVGTVANMIDDFEPDDSEAAIQIQSLLREMETGPVRNHYAAELAKKLSPDTVSPDDDWVLKYGLDGIKQIEKDGVFGAIPKAEVQPVEKYLKAGAFNSLPNLKAVGFTDEQAKTIVAAKDKAGKVTKESVLAAFRDYWPQRGTPPKDADPFILAVMTAIGEGATNLDYFDPEKAKKDSAMQWEIRAKSGRVRDEFIRWRKRNPNADDAAARAEILRLAGSAADAAWDEPMADDLPPVLPPRDAAEVDPFIDLPPP